MTQWGIPYLNAKGADRDIQSIPHRKLLSVDHVIPSHGAGHAGKRIRST